MKWVKRLDTLVYINVDGKDLAYVKKKSDLKGTKYYTVTIVENRVIDTMSNRYYNIQQVKKKIERLFKT